MRRSRLTPPRKRRFGPGHARERRRHAALKHRERAVEVLALMSRHHARAQQRPAALDGGIERDIGVDPGVIERLPESHRLPVVAHQDRYHRGHDALAVRRADPSLDHPVANPRESLAEVTGIGQNTFEEDGPLSRAADADRRQSAAKGCWNGGRREQERSRLDAQEVDHLRWAGDEAAAARERLRERAHAQVDLSLAAERLAGPGAARAQHPDPVCLVDEQAGTVRPAELGDARDVTDVALHREDPVDRDEHASAVGRRSLEHRLELVETVVAKRADLRSRHRDAVHDRGVISRIADDGVGRRENRAEQSDVCLVAGREDERVVGLHPGGDLALELDVQGDRSVQESRARKRGPVALKRVRGGLLDPKVLGQAEIVVRAEHDALGPVHLHERPGLALEQAEIGEQIALARGLELVHALVVAGLVEEVGGCL
ncbi:MAG: hypothetical protein NVS2B6_10530 [Thermoleophilaceae bacterium]